MLALEETGFCLSAVMLLAVKLNAQRQFRLVIQGRGRQQMSLAESLQSLLTVKPTFLSESAQCITPLLISENLACDSLNHQALTQYRSKHSLLCKYSQGFKG